MAHEAATAQTLLAKSPDIPMIPAASWKNAGFATPASALQTLNWAAANRDTNAFLNGVSWDPQARAQADALFAALPDSVRQQYGSGGWRHHRHDAQSGHPCRRVSSPFSGRPGSRRHDHCRTAP